MTDGRDQVVQQLILTRDFHRTRIHLRRCSLRLDENDILFGENLRLLAAYLLQRFLHSLDTCRLLCGLVSVLFRAAEEVE